ncbi:MAG TPA: hypothetical protein VF516_47125 [Kofleriaceae bacterium]
MIARAAMFIALCALACDPPRRPPVTHPAGSELACELKVRDLGTRLGLTFALTNRSPSARTLHYYHPFLQFDLSVTANGRPLTLTQPDIDVPSQPRELHIASGSTAEIDTPISLRFASGDAAASDSMVWTIQSAPMAVELHATLRLDGDTVGPCTTRVERL